MPGYTIVGVKSGMQGWENTDALHCRTRGVMDFEMLFVDHRDVVPGLYLVKENYRNGDSKVRKMVKK